MLYTLWGSKTYLLAILQDELMSNVYFWIVLAISTQVGLKRHLWHYSLSSLDYNKCVCVCSVVQSCPTLKTPQAIACQAPRPWDSPSRTTGVVCHFLLQGIFRSKDQTRVTYVSGIDRQVLYHQHHLGSPCFLLRWTTNVKSRKHKQQNRILFSLY